MTEEQLADLMRRRGRTPPSPAMTSPKRPKYCNRKVTDASGAVHDSTKEFRHWQSLQLRAHAGDIRSLRRQVPYALVWNGILICRFIADFVYEEGAALHVVDCKSEPTRKLQVYRLKKLMMKACHGIEIEEV
jgi:hypothetical protein